MRIFGSALLYGLDTPFERAEILIELVDRALAPRLTRTTDNVYVELTPIGLDILNKRFRGVWKPRELGNLSEMEFGQVAYLFGDHFDISNLDLPIKPTFYLPQPPIKSPVVN